MTLTRRGFMKTAAVTGAAAAMLGITGCANESGNSKEKNDEGSTLEQAINPSKTLDADIVIVGAGMSGLSAAVSASSADKSVILVEANSVVGGNGQGTEGVFACGSRLQKEAGIDFTLEEVITKELEFFNYRIDALAWKDLVSVSADNIDWLMEQGVSFGAVDDYRGQGQLDGFHWFKETAMDGYITPLAEKAEAQGVQVMFNTRARQLVFENQNIAGIYVEEQSGDYTQINCKAVILASGGYADNDEMLEEMGVDTSNITRKGFPHHEGDGLKMALEVGGVDYRNNSCVMREPGCEGYAFESPLGAMGLRSGGPFMFINGKGERYTNENCIVQNQAHAANVVLTQKESFALISEESLQWIDLNVTPGIIESAEDALATGAEAYKADTIEELAQMIEVDVETAKESLARYNELSKQGNDDDFGKDASMMQAMETGPYWAFKHGFFYFSTIGGIKTNRNFEVVDKHDNPISGLWAVGTDGCSLYRETYTVMIPASCNANNVNSGRVAGTEAIKYCDLN